MNPKEFVERWVEGIHNINPTQQLHAKMIMYLGGAIGLFLALLTLIARSVWYFTVFLIFMIGLQYVEFIGARQKWKAACMIEKEFKEEKNEIKKTI